MFISAYNPIMSSLNLGSTMRIYRILKQNKPNKQTNKQANKKVDCVLTFKEVYIKGC